MVSRFETPRVILIGRGAHQELADHILLDEKRHALLICDCKRIDPDVEKNIMRGLNKRGIEFIEYRLDSNFVTNDQLVEGEKLLGHNDFDIIIAIGGRGIIQLGKMLALLATNEGPIEKYAGVNVSRNPSLPVVAVAMTAGCGAAISHCACFVDSESKNRYSLRDQNLLPDLVILDPGLKAWQSPGDTAADGLASLAYAIEAITSESPTPVTDACALAAVTAICRWLPIAYTHGNDIKAREQLMYAQQLVSMAVFNSSPSCLCRLAGQIEAIVHIPFGNVVAALLPHQLERNAEVTPDRVEMIGKAIWEADNSSAKQQKRPPATELLRRFIQRLDLPQRLSFMGMDEGHVERVTKSLEGDHYGNPPGNPNKCQALRDLILRAF